MAETNYKGNIMSRLFIAIENNPDMTMGEIFHSVLHKDNFNGKHFFYCSDLEIHNSIEKFSKVGVEIEEPLGTNEFEFWVENKKFSTRAI